MQDEPESPGGGGSGFMDNLGFAEGRDPSAIEPRPWRLAALVGLVCVVVLVLAVALLDVGGGSGKPKDVGLPSVTSTPTQAQPTPTAATTTVPSSPVSTVHPPKRVHHTTHPPTTSAAPSTSATPTPTPTHSTSTVVAPPPPARSVTVAKGPPDYRCGPSCHFIVVRLTNFAGGHLVQCVSAGGQLYGGAPFADPPHQYVTAQAVSFSCSFDGPGSVWVVVDRTYQSNHVSW